MCFLTLVSGHQDIKIPSETLNINNGSSHSRPHIVFTMVVSSFEEAQKGVVEIGKFSVPLQDILGFILKDLHYFKLESKKENEARKAEIADKFKELDDKIEQDTDRLKDILKRKVEMRENSLFFQKPLSKPLLPQQPFFHCKNSSKI